MKIKKKQKKNFRIISLVISLLAVAGLVSAFALQSYTPSQNKETTTDSAEKAPLDSNYAPTDSDINESQNGKKNGGTTNDSVILDSKKGKVQVGISYADINENDKLEIRAFINGITKGSGTCEATLTKGDQKITKKSKAFNDATSTICGEISVPRSHLDSGKWRIVVGFSTKTHSGTSDPVEVKVP